MNGDLPREIGRWVAKLVARLLATAALWVRIQTSLKIQNGRHKHRSGEHTPAQARQKKQIKNETRFRT
jgi:hypothetical protein